MIKVWAVCGQLGIIAMTRSYRHITKNGMTLIEIMIVVALIASMMTIAAISLGVLGQADVQGDALKFSSMIRYTFNSAATSNETLQMKIDFDSNKFGVEKLELSGGLSDDELRGTTMKSSNSKDHWRDKSRAERLDDEDSKFGKDTRTPVDGVFFDDEDSQLSDGVFFIGLITSHHDDVQMDGVGTINFFANGFVERSVIFIGDETAKNGDEGGVVYSITVNPLTGQSSVTPGQREISSAFFEEEEDR